MPCYTTSRAPVSLKVPGVVIGRRPACCSVLAGAFPTPAVTGNICDCADGTPRAAGDAQPRSARLRQLVLGEARLGRQSNKRLAQRGVRCGTSNARQPCSEGPALVYAGVQQVPHTPAGRDDRRGDRAAANK
jgi:hypothetical protein